MKELTSLWVIVCLFAISSICSQAQLPVPRIDSIFPLGSKAGSSIEVVIKGSDLDPSGKLFFEDSRIKSESLGGNKFKVSVDEEVSPGIYDFRHGGKSGTTSSLSFLVSNLEEFTVQNEAVSKDKAMTIDHSMFLNGLIQKGNAHFFKFSLNENERVFVDCFAERINSRMDALIVVEDPNGNEVGRSREAIGGDPLIDFKAQKSGEYILRVSDFLTRGGDDYWYRVRIRKAAQIDFVFPSSVRVGEKQKFQIFGRNLPEGVPSGDDGLEMIEMDVDVPDVMERQRFGPTKPINVGMKGFNFSIGEGLELSNSVFIPFSNYSHFIENGANATPNDAQKINPPGEVSGRFYSGKKSWFSFDVKTGNDYVVEVVSNRLYSPTDPILSVDKVITDNEGKETITSLGKADDQASNIGGRRYPTNHRDPSLKFKADSDFVARVSIKDNFSTNLPFRLIVRNPKPDYELFVSVPIPDGDNNKGKKIIKGGLAVRSGQVGRLEIFALRKDGYDGQIDVSIKGLPDFFEVRPASISKGQNSCTLSFYNKKHSSEWVGNVEVMGNSEINGEKITKNAESVAVNWSVNDADKERVVSRTSSVMTIASIKEKIPLSVIPVEDKVWESSLGATLEIPVKFESTGEIKDKVTILPIDFPGMGKAPQIQVDKGKTKDAHKLVIPLLNNKDNNKYNEGIHQFVIKATTKLGYRRDLHLLNEAEEIAKKNKEALEANRKSIEPLKKAVEEAKKILEQSKASSQETEEQKNKVIEQAAKSLKLSEDMLKEANSKLKESEALNNKSAEDVKKASERSKPKDIQFVSYSKPVKVKINSTPIKVEFSSADNTEKGSKGKIQLKVQRLFGFADSVSFSPIFPEGLKGIKVTETVCAKDQSNVEIPFEIEDQALVGSVNFDLSCKIKFNGIELAEKVPVSFEVIENKQVQTENNNQIDQEDPQN